MATHEIRTLTSSDFDAVELRHPGVWLVDFTAAWCAPCRALDPTLAALASELAGRVSIGRVDADEQAELMTRFGVRALPTLLLFRDHHVVGQKVGVLPRSKLTAWLDPVSASHALVL